MECDFVFCSGVLTIAASTDGFDLIQFYFSTDNARLSVGEQFLEVVAVHLNHLVLCFVDLTDRFFTFLFVGIEMGLSYSS